MRPHPWSRCTSPDSAESTAHSRSSRARCTCPPPTGPSTGRRMRSSTRSRRSCRAPCAIDAAVTIAPGGYPKRRRRGEVCHAATTGDRCCCDAMAAAQPPWPPPGSPQFAGVRDAWRDATLAEWFLHHPQGKALFRVWAAMQRARWQSPPSGAGAAGAPRAAPAGAPPRPAPFARPEAARAPDAARAGP